MKNFNDVFGDFQVNEIKQVDLEEYQQAKKKGLPFYPNILFKDAVVSLRDKPPLKGKRIMGNNAVTAIGKASVIHHIAIHTAEAKTALAVSLNPSGLKNLTIIIKSTGPRMRPMFCFVNFICDN